MMCHQLQLVIAFVLGCQLSTAAQNEIEFRTDGIVIPRTTTGVVLSPVEGMLVYDTSLQAFHYYDGIIWSAFGGGAFERLGNLVRQKEGYDTDDFVIGRDALPPSNSIDDTMLFFDISKAGFRGGTIDSDKWSHSNLGDNSFAYGNDVLAQGESSVAMGHFTTASEMSAIAMGYFATASGHYSVALGDLTVASGSTSTAMGASTTASGGNGATAMGSSTTASGDRGAIAMGRRTRASGDYGSIALGSHTVASGDTGAVAMGHFTVASGNACTVMGRYNDSLVMTGAPVGTDGPLLIVGNGNSASDRDNALVVRQNGEVAFDHYTFPIQDGSNKHVLSTNGNGQLSWTAEQDGDSTNELQTLTREGSLITLSNGGGSFKDEDDWENTAAHIYYAGGNVGIGHSDPSGYLHIQANDNINRPHLLLTDQGTDAFVRIKMNREGIDKSWFHSATTHDSDDAQSFYSFIYEDDNGAFIDAIRMDGRGYVGIGTFPGSQRLKVDGNASKTTAGDWLANSDRRIKTDIQEIEEASNILLRLHPVKFKYTDEWKSRHPNIDDQYYYNFIAQEYAEVFPESVQGSGEYLENEKEEVLQIDTYNAQVVTIAAVKELIIRLEKSEKEIEELRRRASVLERNYLKQQADVEILKTNMAEILTKSQLSVTSKLNSK